MEIAELITDEGEAYLGWVEEFNDGETYSPGYGDFALLDLLHPDDVKSLRTGTKFADLIERAFDDGLKTLPIVLPVNQMKPEWRTAIVHVVENPGSRLTVRLSPVQIGEYGRAEMALSGWGEENQRAQVVYIDHIGPASAEVSEKVSQALDTADFRTLVANNLPKPQRSGLEAVEEGQFLRDILEWRVGSEAQVFVAVYDVGQGSASAIVDSNEHPRVFFDMGKPISVFNHTRPLNIPKFFSCDEEKMSDGHPAWSHAPIVLSHWDYDHWAGVLKSAWVKTDKRGHKYAKLTLIDGALDRYWIATNQEHLELAPTHMELIRQLLKTVNGTSGQTALQYWPSNLPYLQFSHGVIVRAKPDEKAETSISSRRNNSGLLMLITPTAASIGLTPVGLLLQGDARYESIPLN
ncbi:MAG: hypothetical protein JWR52_3884, partial [Marmoricola sp.]|nr:hypothetical protein [Marmoricola sp.]